jgi:hypothetical protein
MWKERLVRAVWVAALVPWSSLVAQAVGTESRVRGVVFDSTLRRPLADATVQLSRIGTLGVRSTRSDATGTYEFSGLGVGTYVIGFFHPRLDSLGLDGGEWRVDIRTPGTMRVPLAIPSNVTLMRTFCGSDVSTDSVGLVVGRVRSATDGAPLGRSQVRLRWDEFTLSRNGMVRDTVARSVSSSSSGFFAHCGVPAGVTVLLRGTTGTDSSGVLEVEVLPGEVLKRDVFVGRALTIDYTPADSSSIAGGRVSRGDGRVDGMVRSDNGRPIGGARVFVWETGIQVTTSSEGRFRLDSLPTGSWMLEARAIGYVPRRQIIDISSPGPAPIELALTSRRKYLDTVRVLAQRAFTGGRLVDFERRRQRGFGHFLDEAAIERENAFFFTDLLRKIPGVTLRPGNGASTYYIFVRSFGRLCMPDIYVDGLRHIAGSDPNSVIWPDDVIAVEVYTRSPPVEFYNRGGCGAVVVWTGQRTRPEY